MFITSVVRRIDVDALYFPSICREQGLESDQIVTVDDEVVVQRRFFARALTLHSFELMKLHRVVMILNNGFSFEVENWHSGRLASKGCVPPEFPDARLPKYGVRMSTMYPLCI